MNRGRARTDLRAVRARNGALEHRTSNAERAAELGGAAVRQLVHELVKLARGASLADVRIPADAAAALGNRGDKSIREIANRAGFRVTMTRAGYQLHHQAAGDAGAEPNPTEGDPQ